MKQPKGTVRDWMTANPITTTAETSLLRAYELMQERTVRRLPVVDAAGGLVGIITRSDLLQILPFAREGASHSELVFAFAGQSVEDLMTPNPISVAPDDSIGRVAKQMITRKVSGIPVVSNGRVVGIITESDIFRVVVESWPDEQA